MSGVKSCLRLKAKIGKYAYYKPTFFLEDEVKIFLKFQDRVIFYADSENGAEILIRFHQVA
jgi:hypothetical protein